jgi:hypothetical protein
MLEFLHDLEEVRKNPAIVLDDGDAVAVGIRIGLGIAIYRLKTRLGLLPRDSTGSPMSSLLEQPPATA